MAETRPPVTVECVALHLACSICGAQARIPNRHDAWARFTLPGGAFMVAHLGGHVVAAEVLVNGELRVCEVQEA
jgi:hypothetical protein